MKFVLVFCSVITFTIAYPTFLLKNTKENIAKLTDIQPDQNAEELSGQFEGDIVLTVEQWAEINGILPLTGRIPERYRWPNNTIPYSIDPTFSTAQLAQILNGLVAIENATCLIFVPKNDSHTDYIDVEGEDTGCWSSVGRIGGRQVINLQRFEPGLGCFRIGTVIHEFIHALGFYHMQSAYDRDNFVTIAWEHITPGLEHNFNKYNESLISHFGVPYDFGSVMHYSEMAFSKDGNRTIIPHDPKAQIGQRLGMTEKDIQRLINMYCVD